MDAGIIYQKAVAYADKELGHRGPGHMLIVAAYVQAWQDAEASARMTILEERLAEIRLKQDAAHREELLHKLDRGFGEKGSHI